ncbi:MAG TPA: VOC family protein [Polyangiaceae bacterium]|nr:VOC family protein [Polyangiaceae bacterium]
MNTATPSPYVVFTGVHHLAFITGDLEATVRFYRDLLGLPLGLATAEGATRHYFFQLTERDAIAFFGWDDAAPIAGKRPGVPTRAPRGFDHVAIGVASKGDLFAMRDRLAASGVAVEGPIDHGLGWSIYFKDPNNLDLELTWNAVELSAPLLADPDAPAAAREGSAPRPEAWPALRRPPAERSATPGAGHELGRYAVENGLGRYADDAGRAAP